MTATRVGQSRWPDMYVLLVSHSAADIITFLMVLHIMWTGVFVIWSGVLFGLFPKMNQAAERLRDLGRNSKAGLVLVITNMLLIWYWMTQLGYLYRYSRSIVALMLVSSVVAYF